MKNIMYRLMVAGLLLVLVLTLIPNRAPYEKVGAQTNGSDSGIAEIDLSVRGTYLHADPYHGGGGSVESPVIVELQAYGISPQDKVKC